jgi:hypothetical protein
MSVMACPSPEGQRPSVAICGRKTGKIVSQSWNHCDKLRRFDMVRNMEPDAASGSLGKNPKIKCEIRTTKSPEQTAGKAGPEKHAARDRRGIKTSEPSSQYAAPAGVNWSVLEIGRVDAGERPHARSIDAADDAENIAPRSLTTELLPFGRDPALRSSGRSDIPRSRLTAARFTGA